MTWNYQNFPNRSNEIKNSTKRITATWKLSQGQDVKKLVFMISYTTVKTRNGYFLIWFLNWSDTVYILYTKQIKKQYKITNGNLRKL